MFVEESIQRIPGLTRSYTFYHFTDSHMCYAAPDDTPENKARYEHVKNHYAGSGDDVLNSFNELFSYVNESDGDFLLLTGDIMEGYNEPSAKYLKKCMEESTKEVLYIPGNHEVRNFVYTDLMKELAHGNPAYWVKELGDLLVVGIDDNNRELNEEQVEFLKAPMGRGIPIILVMHIPIYSEASDIPLRIRWGGDGHDLFSLGLENTSAEMMKIVKMIKQPENNIAAIFAGHAHFSHAGEFAPGGGIQYISSPGFDKYLRKVTFIPL